MLCSFFFFFKLIFNCTPEGGKWNQEAEAGYNCLFFLQNHVTLQVSLKIFLLETYLHQTWPFPAEMGHKRFKNNNTTQKVQRHLVAAHEAKRRWRHEEAVMSRFISDNIKNTHTRRRKWKIWPWSDGWSAKFRHTQHPLVSGSPYWHEVELHVSL